MKKFTTALGTAAVLLLGLIGLASIFISTADFQTNDAITLEIPNPLCSASRIACQALLTPAPSPMETFAPGGPHWQKVARIVAAVSEKLQLTDWSVRGIVSDPECPTGMIVQVESLNSTRSVREFYLIEIEWRKDGWVLKTFTPQPVVRIAIEPDYPLPLHGSTGEILSY